MAMEAIAECSLPRNSWQDLQQCVIPENRANRSQAAPLPSLWDGISGLERIRWPQVPSKIGAVTTCHHCFRSVLPIDKMLTTAGPRKTLCPACTVSLGLSSRTLFLFLLRQAPSYRLTPDSLKIISDCQHAQAELAETEFLIRCVGAIIRQAKAHQNDGCL